jgi:peptidoglycan hydrolase CwlO-like protein
VLPLTIAQAAEPVVAELSQSQMSYFPVTLWALVTGLSLVIVIVVLCTYLFYNKFLKALGDDTSSLANLAAQKKHLEADIEQCRNWLRDNREELLRQDTERQEQERLRQELATLQMECEQVEQRRDNVRTEAGDLQNVVSTLVQDRDRLLAEKEALNEEKDQAETATKAAEEERQRADTEAKQAEHGLRALEARYKEEKERVDQLVQEIADKEVRQQLLMREVTALTETRAAWQDELLKLEAERRAQEDLRRELEGLQTELSHQEQRVDDLQSKANDLQHVVSTLTQDRDRLTTEKVELAHAKTEAEATARAAEETRHKSVTEAEQARQEMEEATQHLREILRDISEKEIRQQSLMHRETTLATQLAELDTRLAERQKEILAVEEKLAGLRADLTPLEEILTQKKQAQRERDELLGDARDLKASIASLKQERVGLEKSGDSSRYADLLETSPKCLSETIFLGGEVANRIEEEVLDELQQNLKAQGLLFSDRILKAFHTSLKVSQISPLTVLAGVSGTGKSILPLEYAKAMGMHSLIVSVQPRWDSPQDLFGFYNYLEHKYKATDLARALVRMDKYNFLPGKFSSLQGQKRNERMLLVLLDEMNLARIEYYFSEFLSKLEIRRLVTEPSQQDQRALAEFELETGPRSAEDNIFSLWVGENVLFVGTMNEDESTQTLSDKVLDRANVLRFGRPPEGVSSTRHGNGATHNGKFLTFSEWQGWMKHPYAGNRWDNDVNRWIASVNEALDQIGRPFGYRVQQAIREYILQYPGVDGGRIYARAFADQVEQKVLPKLRGIDVFANASKEALDKVQGVLEELGDEDLTEAFRKSKDDESTGTFVWRGVTRAV